MLCLALSHTELRRPRAGQGRAGTAVLRLRLLCVSLQLKSKWDEFIFTKGCIQALEGWLPRNIYIVAGVFIAISLLQVRPAVQALGSQLMVCRKGIWLRN